MPSTLSSVGTGASTGAALGSVIPGVGTAVGGAIGAVYGLASGLINAGKAKKEASALGKSRPQYQIPAYAGQDVALAESDLANGGSAAAKSAYQEGMDRDLSASLDAVLKGGGSPNNIADVFDRSAEGRQRYAIMQDNLRLNQFNNVVKAHDYYNDQLDKEYQLNKFAPWADKAQANAAERNAASTQVNQGVNTLGNLATLFNQNGFNNYFNQQPQQRQQSFVPYQTSNNIERTTSPIPDMTNFQTPSYINPNSMSAAPAYNFGNNNFIGPLNYTQ